MKEQRFDELLKDIREESATAQEVAAARRRVRSGRRIGVAREMDRRRRDGYHDQRDARLQPR